MNTMQVLSDRELDAVTGGRFTAVQSFQDNDVHISLRNVIVGGGIATKGGVSGGTISIVGVQNVNVGD
ncbi:MAG TPA: hypothetical protein VFG62_23600 [Rhodopila sp.]|jgi:hypothetical protein|nr:hypothetical protein [Rhodopila sp.]